MTHIQNKTVWWTTHRSEKSIPLWLLSNLALMVACGCLDQWLSCFFIDKANEPREVSLYAPWPSRNCHTEALLFLRVRSLPKNRILQGADVNLWTTRSFHWKVHQCASIRIVDSPPPKIEDMQSGPRSTFAILCYLVSMRWIAWGLATLQIRPCIKPCMFVLKVSQSHQCWLPWREDMRSTPSLRHGIKYTGQWKGGLRDGHGLQDRLLVITPDILSHVRVTT